MLLQSQPDPASAGSCCIALMRHFLWQPHTLCLLQVGAEETKAGLHVADVTIPLHVQQRLQQAWHVRPIQGSQRAAAAQTLYPIFEDFQDLVQQTLSRDIRSVHQRLHSTDPAAVLRSQQYQQAAGRPPETGHQPKYYVVLCGIDILYDIDDQGHVTVADAFIAGTTNRCIEASCQSHMTSCA